ncbi:hypothetical protein BC332_15160 [Capsicum chinense]|nr:hypothetical protein BC332_15160 [Capsicum chinense]
MLVVIFFAGYYPQTAVVELDWGRHEETIKKCTKALELNPTYIKALVKRAEAHEKLEHFGEAITDMKKILEIEPSHNQARKSVICLKPLADEKQEKMKEEMIGGAEPKLLLFSVALEITFRKPVD